MVLMHLYRGDARNTIVAHFDHGIRPNSGEDLKFVRTKAEEYGMHFEWYSAELGEDCSEEKAREARYKFLFSMAQKYDAILTTAHHRDDVVESIVINLLRGTGWRGLVPMNNKNIKRPLLKYFKSDIYRIAAENNLSFRQDQTNTEEKYLRNRVRNFLRDNPELKNKIVSLYEAQKLLGDEIDENLAELTKNSEVYNRKAISGLPEDVAQEILRKILSDHNISQTRPQQKRALDAIKNYQNGKIFELSKNSKIRIGRKKFEILTSSE